MRNIIILASLLWAALLPASVLAGCGKYRSSLSSQSVNITFKNKTAWPVNVIWYDFRGRDVKYNTLAPAQSYVQSTYVDHVWKFTTAKGKCITSFVAKRSQSFVIR